MQTISIDIEGMSCGGCVASVTRVLKGVPGVADAAVTLAPPRARVTFDPDKASLAQLKSAIEDAGYGVGA